jgi:MGT family glycosyltransferase
MSKAVFFGTPLYGHTNPTIPLVRRLVASGEEVVYYSNQTFEEDIRQTGAQFRAYRDKLLVDATAPAARVGDRNLAGLFHLAMRATQGVLAQELEAIRKEPPDYIIYDAGAFWGKSIAQILRIPAVCSVVIFAVNRHVVKLARGSGLVRRRLFEGFSNVRELLQGMRIRRNMRKIHGKQLLHLQDVLFPRADSYIVYTSRFFQPFSETFDERFHFIGPAIPERQEQVDFPWDRVTHPDIIYVSLGTLFNWDREFFRICFEALGGLNADVIVSTGGGIPAAAFEQVPANFILRDFVPQLAILSKARVFITHGGMNSASESFYSGVPVVVIPNVLDQVVTARRIQDMGAGLYLKRSEVNSATLREAVLRVLSDEAYRRKSAEIGESFRKAGGVAAAVDAIFRFKARHGI